MTRLGRINHMNRSYESYLRQDPFAIGGPGPGSFSAVSPAGSELVPKSGATKLRICNVDHPHSA